MAAATDMRDLRAAWRALAGGGEGEGWKTIHVGILAPCALLAGRRLPGDEEAVLLGFRNIGTVPESHLPQGQGFEVCRVPGDRMGGDRFWMALARRPSGSPELFAMMAEDVVRMLESGTAGEEGLIYRFLARIRAWQDFMERHREGVLSPEGELGLFGELVLLESLIVAGMSAGNVLDGWQGPMDGLQDFRLGSGGIEVKTTLSAAGFPATITSLEQLDDSLCRPLFLAAVRLGLDATGISLPDMAGVIREKLRGNQSALDTFEVRLVQAGLLGMAADQYSRRFRHVSSAILLVDEGFPHITRANIHLAIRKARYEIDLDLAGAADMGLSRALELLGAV